MLLCSYALHATQAFSADTQTVCVSGGGFAHSVSSGLFVNSSSELNPTARIQVTNYPNTSMDDVFWRVLTADSASPGIDTSAWQPAAVVINLGTNDISIPHATKGDLWVTTYVAFLRRLRAAYPAAHFLLGCFPMGTSAPTLRATRRTTSSLFSFPATYMNDAIRIVVQAFADQANKTTYLDFADIKGGQGCYGHPSAIGHAAMADATQAVLSEVLGW